MAWESNGALQMFQPKYTMNGYELKEEPKANSVGHSRVLRTLLTSKLPVLHSAICSRVAEVFAQDLPNSHEETGMATPRSTGNIRVQEIS